VQAANTQMSQKIDGAKLRDELRQARALIPDQPALNPIVNMAFKLSRDLESGQINFQDLKDLATRLMDRAAIRRARHLKDQIGYVDDQTTLAEFSKFVAQTVGADPRGDKAFEDFEQRWTRARSGIVFTAHPTFGCSKALSDRMVQIAMSGTDDGHHIGLPHRPDDGISLEYEHKSVSHAIAMVRDAYVDVLKTFYSVSAAGFGDKAYKLRPNLMTVASWVGYDLDGRTDINWLHTFVIRLREKRAALIDIRERFQKIRPQLGEAGEMPRLVRQMIGKLDLAVSAVETQVRAAEQANAKTTSGDLLAKAANAITQSDGYNLVSTEPLLQIFDALIDAAPDGASKKDLAALSSLVQATGLGSSHIHLRVNAVQINNAFRAFVHESWTKDLTERQAQARIVEMIRTVKPETVNFASLDLEQATAIRQFALAAQIRKHVDRDTPIRYLIAECESPATILIAIYFAKLFGVDDIVDISPLFETPAALETGSRLIERLLALDPYRSYVKRRGRIAVQTGYSDAGRFIGQIAAGLAHERLQHGLADTVEKSGLTGIETLIYSTHGESMGRGTHPGTLRRRFRYLLSGESRWRFFRHGLPLKHETSFQGGDGYMYFANQQLATRVLTTVIMDGRDPGEGVDPFYTDTNLSLDFQIRLRDYQQDLFKHPGYRALLGAFGANLLFKTGSRPVKRQGDHASDRGDPARMRAIPNNAILQQFGYTANVVSGLGAAVGSERDRFVDLAKRSPRLRPLIEMIARAKQLSSLNAVGANAVIFDAGFWAMRASWGREPHLEAAFKLLSTRLLGDTRSQAVNGLAHHLRLDAIELHGILDEIGIEGGKIPDEHRLELDLLHAIRLALMMRIFILAARLPRFTATSEASYDQIFQQALALDIPDVARVMRVAFPKRASDAATAAQFDEQATYLPRGMDDYGRIETEILEPMEQAYDMVREIGTGISHHWGAFG
jgi:phosphoenolpyruvate carboxylase